MSKTQLPAALKALTNTFLLAMESSRYTFFASPLTRSQVQVVASADYDRRRASDEMEKDGEEVWLARVAANPHLFNGTKFRFGGMVVKGGEQERCDVGETAKLEVVLPTSEGITVSIGTGFGCYKDYTMTNMSVHAESFAAHGAKQFGDIQACMGDIIGHSGLVLTSDGYVVIQLRSQTVGEACGMWHFPGGHPEPEELGITCSAELASADPRKVVDEIYDSLLREMKEELNLPDDLLSDPLLVSVGLEKHSFFKPEFNFIIRTKLSAADISARYFADDFVDEESDDIGFIKVCDLDRLDENGAQIWRFKFGEAEVSTVKSADLANSTRQLVDCLPYVLKHNIMLLS